MRFSQSTIAAACAVVLASSATGLAQEPKVDASDVAVTVTYKGAGTVDREHRIWIFLYRPKDAKTASPVKPGDAITITFDDTNRMQ